MKADATADARLALACLYAEDGYDAAQARPGVTPLDVPLDLRLSAGWTLRGHIVGTDALLVRRKALTLADRQVWYGCLLEAAAEPGAFLLVIRGTKGFLEWLEDADFRQVRHPRAGGVEAGFWGVYASLEFRRQGGPNAPLAAALSAIVGAGRLTVTGHSLGAALATYLATDLADPDRLGAHIALRAFASPHPGDGLFAQYASARLTDYRLYARELDVVPRLPFLFGYSALPTDTIAIGAGGIRVCFDARCNHHALSYALQIDPSCIDPATLPPIDKPYADCIRMPVALAPAA